MGNDDRTNNKSTGEENNYDPSRRRFVKNTGYVLGGLAGGSILGGLLTNQFQTTKEAPPQEQAEKLFSEARMFFRRYEDFVILEHATERIYPEDENGPGAIGLGVPYFIDRQLAGPWGKNVTDYRQGPFEQSNAEYDDSRLTRGDLFLKGLRKMNELSIERFDAPFHEASEDQQIEILSDFEAEKVELEFVNSASFFELLRMSVLEGAYSDPMYGGNRNMEGWKMKEYPGSVPSYADIIEEDEFVKLDPISLTDYQQKTKF